MEDDLTQGWVPFPIDDGPSSQVQGQETSALLPPPPDLHDPLLLRPTLTPHPDFQIQPANHAEILFRHSGWAPQRHLIFEAFEHLHIGAARMDRFCNCGSGCSCYYSPSTDTYQLKANYCHDRFCVPCMTARSRLVERNLHDLCGDRPLKFITLTLAHSDDPLTDQIKRLTEAFAKLRAGKLWKQHVKGGVAVFELKVGRDTRWHPHLHILCDAAYIPHSDLAANWHAVTGDSYIVDIRRKDEHTIGYVCKYAAKALDSSIYKDHAMLCEAITAIQGKRLFNTFGSWRGWKLDDSKAPDPGDWRKVCSLVQLTEAVERHELWADVLMAKLTNSPPPLHSTA